MLAIWQGHVDIIADTHASSTYQRIQINSLFGRISASALDTRRRGGGCVEKLFQPLLLCRRREPQKHATRKWLLEHVSVVQSPKQKKSPYGSSAPQESNRTTLESFTNNVSRSFEWTSYKYAGNVCWRKMIHIFPRHSIYLDIYVFALIIFSISHFNSHCWQTHK